MAARVVFTIALSLSSTFAVALAGAQPVDPSAVARLAQPDTSAPNPNASNADGGLVTSGDMAAWSKCTEEYKNGAIDDAGLKSCMAQRGP